MPKKKASRTPKPASKNDVLEAMAGRLARARRYPPPRPTGRCLIYCDGLWARPDDAFHNRIRDWMLGLHPVFLTRSQPADTTPRGELRWMRNDARLERQWAVMGC